MPKESLKSQYPNLIFRETFDSEQDVMNNGGTPTAVTFANGIGTFNGSSSRIIYSHKFPKTNSWSIRARVVLNEIPAEDNVIVGAYVDSNNQIRIYHRGSGSFGIYGVLGGSVIYNINVGGSFVAKQPVEFVVTVNNTAVQIYKNGVLFNSPSAQVGGIIAGGNIEIGSLNNALFWDGTCDLFEIYKGTLTASEVKNLYDNSWDIELPFTISRTMPQYACNVSVTGWKRCADDNGADSGLPNGAGKSLKAIGQGNGDDLAGFGGKLSGSRNTDGSYNNLGGYLFLWSSTPYGASYAWYRYLSSSYATVFRYSSSRAYGFSVRCLRDIDDTSDFTDTRDGNVYQCVKIGTQVWMKKNLAYLPSVNAVADGSVTDPKYYVYGYDGTDVATAKATANYTDYGVLYNYPAALISVPTGFHLPSDEELNTLEVYTVGIVKALNPDKLILDFNSTNGVLQERTGKTLTATDVSIVKSGSKYSAKFNGSTSKIDTGSDCIGTKAVTVCGWIKANSFGEGSVGAICYNEKFVFRLNSLNNVFQLYSDGITNILSANNSISFGGFIFIAITRKIDGKASFYIGGGTTAPILSGSAEQSSGTPTAGTTNLIIGNNNAGTRTFDGLIPTVKIYEGILDLPTITKIWSETRKDII